MVDWNYGRTWYHGSPFELKTLRRGSTITQDRKLAEIFSHKPAIVSVSDAGEIRHNGTASGLLYTISEEIQPGDVSLHPRTAMEVGKEWLTNRELELKLIGPAQIVAEEQLSEKELEELEYKSRRKQHDQTE